MTSPFPLSRLARLHYGWVIVGLTFVTLLVAQAIRSTPGLLALPLEHDFGWDRASISLGVAISLLAFGLGGPLGGATVDRFGPRRVMVAGCTLIATGIWLLTQIHELWQFYVV